MSPKSAARPGIRRKAINPGEALLRGSSAAARSTLQNKRHCQQMQNRVGGKAAASRCLHVPAATDHDLQLCNQVRESEDSAAKAAVAAQATIAGLREQLQAAEGRAVHAHAVAQRVQDRAHARVSAEAQVCYCCA